MKQSSFVRAGEIQHQLAHIAKARQCWAETAYLGMLADLVGVPTVTRRPSDALQIPAISSFKQMAMERLASDEAMLRREFDAL